MQAATFTAVVVFPTPPFWLAIAYTVPMAATLAGGAADLAVSTMLARSQRRDFAESGRFLAMPVRRGYFTGVGATFRTT